MKKYRIDVKTFRDMFGEPVELDGVEGRINKNNRFYPDDILDQIVSDHIKSDQTIEIPIENKTKYFG